MAASFFLLLGRSLPALYARSHASRVCLLDCCADCRQQTGHFLASFCCPPAAPGTRLIVGSGVKSCMQAMQSYARDARDARDASSPGSHCFCLVVTGDFACAGLDAFAERQTTCRADSDITPLNPAYTRIRASAPFMRPLSTCPHGLFHHALMHFALACFSCLGYP